jgi:hypothetical protein
MSRDDALALADEVLANLRNHSYDECRDLMNAVSRRELRGRDGKVYQVQIEAFWDGRKNGNIRVMVAVSGGGFSDFKPWCRDFIIQPDGSFVGEN